MNLSSFSLSAMSLISKVIAQNVWMYTCTEVDYRNLARLSRAILLEFTGLNCSTNAVLRSSHWLIGIRVLQMWFYHHNAALPSRYTMVYLVLVAESFIWHSSKYRSAFPIQVSIDSPFFPWNGIGRGGFTTYVVTGAWTCGACYCCCMFCILSAVSWVLSSTI